jgi:hypothetical protein
MSALLLKRDRDAWGPIRGFVDQVDLTIERWLRLQPNQLLELEHGEDIDTVSKAITASVAADQSRILEQIKARENNITLRSPQALEALASFHEHFSANSVGIDLSFRYVTNAVQPLFLPSPITDKTPATSPSVACISHSPSKVSALNSLRGLPPLFDVVENEGSRSTEITAWSMLGSSTPSFRAI